MNRFALLISYDGTRYCGWQKQSKTRSEKLSIQDVLEEALHTITGERLSFFGSGRTDAGVHANGQVAHLQLSLQKRNWEAESIRRGLNSQLPKSVRILKAKAVEEEFHAQRGVYKKQYSYYFQQGPSPLPQLTKYSWWRQTQLDVSCMHQSVQSLVGRHDFKVFCASGSSAKTTVREIFQADVERVSEGPFLPHGFELVRFRVTGSGFLKQMVRAIAGTLVEIGEHRRSNESFMELLASQDRRKIGKTAPAKGLWLEQVWYPGFEF